MKKDLQGILLTLVSFGLGWVLHAWRFNSPLWEPSSSGLHVEAAQPLPAHARPALHDSRGRPLAGGSSPHSPRQKKEARTSVPRDQASPSHHAALRAPAPTPYHEAREDNPPPEDAWSSDQTASSPLVSGGSGRGRVLKDSDGRPLRNENGEPIREND